ncbi:hypothetical protein J0895_16770 [Phormidium pseudopriestleyi FRX01]|uniref:Uncharacterized protein n=1 Tax=Phormidium pseudopriestleyi FRX01 TaxID=1759528 RepID=A0ABS3FUB6_9CYAN|nr:hypothetical protein [Phormidium pseudopriestleyi]MBO0350714.1 hypothetical protein [Phormidium pseudopriestleyi FRX01]
MALRDGPLPGYYVEAITGILKDKTASNQTEVDNDLCFIKDYVAQWLGLSIATPRVGVFNNTNNSNQVNAGKEFAIKGQRGSYQYKILLIPATPIPVSYYDPSTGALVSESIPRNSVSISLSRTIGVAFLRAWLINKVGAGVRVKLLKQRQLKSWGLSRRGIENTFGVPRLFLLPFLMA